MKKFSKFISIFLLCTLLFVSFPSTPVSAANNLAGFDSVDIVLDFKFLGEAVFFTTVIPTKASYYSKTTMKLQRYSNGSWHTLASGTHGATGVNAFSSSYFVTKGYTYRVYSTVTIYKSKGGKKINSDTFTYKNKYK